MMTVLIILGCSLLGLIALSSLLYLFVFARPRAGKCPDDRLLCDYAHRGLHGGSIPENSLAAFALAKEKGYGMELDVQLSKDGEVMVFHDYTLVRMTGTDGKLANYTKQELQSMHLKQSGEVIPTFKQVLELVDGEVPLLVELKGENLDSSLCQKVAELLKDYKGPYCIESFNPLLIRKIQQFLPDAYIGQLYTNVVRDKKKKSALNILLTIMGFNFLARPDFIAYNIEDRNSFPVKLTTKFYHAPKFVWTVKNDEELADAHAHGECPIFEKE
jgi:glycerophosphoryl diester phosphodiesterase